MGEFDVTLVANRLFSEPVIDTKPVADQAACRVGLPLSFSDETCIREKQTKGTAG